MSTNNYFIGPQDGWTPIVVTGPLAFFRVSSVPHTHPFYIFGDPSTVPTDADAGVFVCDQPFKVVAGATLSTDSFFVRVKNPVSNSKNSDGRLRIDVYANVGSGTPPPTGVTSDSTLVTSDSTLITADSL